MRKNTVVANVAENGDTWRRSLREGTDWRSCCCWGGSGGTGGPRFASVNNVDGKWTSMGDRPKLMGAIMLPLGSDNACLAKVEVLASYTDKAYAHDGVSALVAEGMMDRSRRRTPRVRFLNRDGDRRSDRGGRQFCSVCRDS